VPGHSKREALCARFYWQFQALKSPQKWARYVRKCITVCVCVHTVLCACHELLDALTPLSMFHSIIHVPVWSHSGRKDLHTRFYSSQCTDSLVHVPCITHVSGAKSQRKGRPTCTILRITMHTLPLAHVPQYNARFRWQVTAKGKLYMHDFPRHNVLTHLSMFHSITHISGAKSRRKGRHMGLRTNSVSRSTMLQEAHVDRVHVMHASSWKAPLQLTVSSLAQQSLMWVIHAHVCVHVCT
jgi:hypothetical protein